MAEDSKTPIAVKMVRLVWTEPGATILANQALVQYDGNLVYLTFGHANPPIILAETEEEKQKQLDAVDSMSVSSVLRVAMTPATFRSVADVMQKHLGTMGRIDKAEHKA
jgi:hypothetical protein